jgi:CRISPR-associated protein Cmr5
MSKRNIEKHIPKALKVLQETFGDTIASSYNGYISSFGASIMQSGLKPTLALFENENASTLQKKQLLTSIILQILDDKTTETSLLKYVIGNNMDETQLKKQILDISIAVKLSIRTFKLEKGKKDE